MVNNIDFSIIIPHRNSVSYLPILLSTIPKTNQIEIILVDNSVTPIAKTDVITDRDFILLYSDPNKGAGGARNLGIKNAHGKWIVFADADDYFENRAFDLFYNYFESEADIVYFGMGGIYVDTNEVSDRGDKYTELVRNFLAGLISENKIRTCFSSPCSKMIKSKLINERCIRFDEVVSSNDVYFSLLSGYYANKIDACDKIVYIATVSKGSLTKRRDYIAMISRLEVSLRRNKFLREKKLGEYQDSILYYVVESLKSNWLKIFKIIFLIVKYGQNPFIGYSRWHKTLIKIMNRRSIDKRYIVK